jgi:hypothetical protein
MMPYYKKNITNNFPGGLFKFVHEIWLLDERPFEHEFLEHFLISNVYLWLIEHHKSTNDLKNQRITTKIMQSLNFLILLNYAFSKLMMIM